MVHELPVRALVFVAVTAGIALPLLGRVARAEVPGPTAPRVVLGGRVEHVVAAGAGVAALRDGEVLEVDPDGRVVGGCRDEAANLGRDQRPDRTARPREEVLGEAGLSDEDVSPEAEELLEDEGLEPPSGRSAVTARAGTPRATALAGTDEGVWIGTVDGLWRLEPRGARGARPWVSAAR